MGVSRSALTFVPTERFLDQRYEFDDLAMYPRVVNLKAALGHHLEIAKA
jgi:hypothetical protein